MLVIRLARVGRTKYPTYRIVAADSARAATGRFVAQLGHYNPHTKELVIKHEETEKYLSTGAQPSNTVVKLLQRDGVTLPAWVKLKIKAPKPQAAATDETEVSEAEASQDADGAPVGEAATDEQRVAEVAEEAAIADEVKADVIKDTADQATA
jgi:small subunit ribosomal protein S16